MQDTLGRRLRVLRAERGLTLRDAEHLTGVDKDTLSKLERGMRHPQDVTLAKIAKGYGVPVEELIEEPVPLGEAPEAGPNVEPSREAPLLDDPHIVALLREWGYETHEEHRTAFEDFDPGIDEKGIPRGIERAEEKLQQDLNELLRELRRPTNYKKLFPERSSFSKADELGSDHIQVLRASYASKLRREVRRIYERRFRALESFGEALYDAGRTKAFLVPARRLNIVKAAREHALEEAFAEQRAG